MRDYATDDLTSITGQSVLNLTTPPFPVGFFGSGHFHGGYGSELGVDVHLGADGDPDNASDILALGGDIYGSTGVIINDVNLGPGGFNLEGIPVVVYGHDYTGFSAYIENPSGYGPSVYGDAFFVSEYSPNFIEMGGVPGIEKGWYFYTMFQDDYEFSPYAGAFELRGLAGPGAINAPRILTGMQDFWYHTDEVVQDHNYAYSFMGDGGCGADLAVVDYAAPAAAPCAPGSKAGLWVKGTGSWVERDTTTSAGGISVANGSDQDIYSILGGADMKPGGADSNWRLGLYGGYGTSTLDFDLGSDEVEYKGGIVGGYLAYNNGAFYADATVKGDILSADYSFGGITANADTYNVGVRLNTGYRFTMGGGFFEPLASFTYVHSDIDDMTGGGGTASFSNGKSLRAGGGARVGYEGNGYELSLLGRVWNEFEGNNTVTITDGLGNSASFTDDTEGLIGEATARITVGRELGWSGFLEGGGEWGDNNLSAYSAKGGVRYGF